MGRGKWNPVPPRGTTLPEELAARAPSGDDLTGGSGIPGPLGGRPYRGNWKPGGPRGTTLPGELAARGPAGDDLTGGSGSPGPWAPWGGGAAVRGVRGRRARPC